MGKALVLGGGGVAGVAWETGVVLGLRDLGVDLTDADLFVGTSAGSVVAAQLATGADPAALYGRQLLPPEQTAERNVEFDVERFTTTLLELLADQPTGRELRRRLGAMALGADTVPEHERRAIIEARLPVHDWPDRPLVVTAVDAHDGELVPFDREGEAGLVDAVAASCAVPGVWPPVTIGERRYVDGGVRSTINADLAADHERIVVLVPVGVGLAGDVQDEVAALRHAGAAVAVVVGDDASRAAFGANPLDPATRRPSAEAGRAQAASVAAAVAEVWR